jgi:Glyoxalase-like domain
MEIDHIFMFVEPNGPELDQIKALGLIETYRREHPGQGTANVCFAFENMFIELLWMVDPLEALSPPIVRTGLEPRSRWKTAGTCPFGIAWRGEYDGSIETWDFAPPYLPAGVTIDVAVDSDDPLQPMMFTFPGSKAPANWNEARKGDLQRASGLQIVSQITLTLPFNIASSPALQTIVHQCTPSILLSSGVDFGLELIFEGTSSRQVCKLGRL